MKPDFGLDGTQEDQRGPIESDSTNTATTALFLDPVTGRYGGASSDLSLILDLVAREMARKHTASYNIGFSEATALFRETPTRKWVYAIARGWVVFWAERLRRSPLLCGRKLFSSLRARRSVPLWTATITSMATGAFVPD
jgi:hypothetical protein